MTQIERLSQQKQQLENSLRELNAQINLEQKKCQDAELARKDMALHIFNLQQSYAEQLETNERAQLDSRKNHAAQHQLLTEFQACKIEFQSKLQVLQTQLATSKGWNNSAIQNLKKSVVVPFSDSVQQIAKVCASQQELEQHYARQQSEFLSKVAEIRTRISVQGENENLYEQARETFQKEIQKLKQSMAVEIQSLQNRLENETSRRIQAESLCENFQSGNGEPNSENSNSTPRSLDRESEHWSKFQEELQRRQSLEEQNRQLQLELNTLQVLNMDRQDSSQTWQKERDSLLSELESSRTRFQSSIEELCLQLKSAELHRAHLENTKSALESTIEMLTMRNSVPGQSENSHQAILEEHNQSRLEIERLYGQVCELRAKLKQAEERAYSNSNSNDVQRVNRLEEQLVQAHQENASLSAKLQSTQALLASLHDDSTEDVEEDSSSFGHFVPPPPPPGIPPPPPPPPTMPSSSNGTSLESLQNSARSLKPVADVPAAVQSSERGDLMAQIRSKTVQLKPIAAEDSKPGEQTSEDPQNMLQVLARVLLARRDGIEDDEDFEDENEELWDDN